MREEVTVHEAVVAPLTTWENFYTIAGSAAAALTGLMFMVMQRSPSQVEAKE